MTRTHEEIARALTEKCYDMAHEDYTGGYVEAEASIMLVILAALNEATTERDKELLEQARLLGMGGEREAALLAKVEQKDREIARLRSIATREGALDALTELDQLREYKARREAGGDHKFLQENARNLYKNKSHSCTFS